MVQVDAHTRGDLELLGGSASGDHAAFAELIRRYQPAVRAVLWGYTKHAWELEDLQQEVWLQAWLGIRTIRHHERVSAWFQGVARNVGRHWAAREHRRVSAKPASVNENDTLPAPVAGQAPGSVAEISGFVDLKPRHRELLRLKYDLELSYAEIATRTGTSVRAVQSALHRARQRLGVVPRRVDAKEVPMIEVDVAALVLLTYTDDESEARVAVEFRARRGETGLWMVWGRSEAEAALQTLESRTSARPLTHDLTLSLMSALCGQLQAVEISKLEGTTFFATLRVVVGDREIEVDARPSDAVNLALRAGSPLFVAEQVLTTEHDVQRPFDVGTTHLDMTVTAKQRLWPSADASDNP